MDAGRQGPSLLTNQVLYLNPSEKYHIHWPMRRGRLNLHGGVGGSLVAVMSHLESIWAVAIQRYLDIPLRDLKVTPCQHLPEKWALV